MIIEIALGIVFAVVILAFLPEIMALGVMALSLAILLAVLAVAVYFVFATPEFALALLAMAAILGAAIYFEAQNGPVARKVKRLGLILGFGVVAFLVVGIFFIGALIVHLELVPLVIVLPLSLAAFIMLIKFYNDVFGLSPGQRKFFEQVSLGIKWLPANNTAQSLERKGEGHGR